MIRRIAVPFVVILCGWATLSEAAEGTITLTDREILDRLAQQGERIARLEEAVNGLQNQIQDLRQTVLGGFGVLFTAMMGLIGFVLWDRRTALAPAIRETEKVKEALRQIARNEPRVAESLRSLGLL